MKSYVCSIVVVFMLASCGLNAASQPAPAKRMQLGSPFTLVLELNPTGAPTKSDSVISVGNRIMLGHSKSDFTWYIAPTTGKWVKLTSGAAVIGFPAKIALSFDGKILRSYYNNTLVGSLPLSTKQFSGLVPIKLNEWLGSYHAAMAYAKSLNQQQIEAFVSPAADGGNNTTSSSGSGTTVNQDLTSPTQTVDPTLPTDIEPVRPVPNNPSQPTDVTPVEPNSSDPTQPTDIQPVEPNSTDTSKPVDVNPVEPAPVDPTQPTDIQPSQPGSSDPTQPTDIQPVEPNSTDATQPTEITPAEPTPSSSDQPKKPVPVEPVKQPTPDLPADIDAPSAKRITVSVKVIAITVTPEPAKILPYKHAIVTQEVEVLSVDKGKLLNIKKGDKLRIARWGILQGQKTDVAKTKVGDKLMLPLEEYKDHNELERQYTVDTLPESYDLPYLLDVSE